MAKREDKIPAGRVPGLTQPPTKATPQSWIGGMPVSRQSAEAWERAKRERDEASAPERKYAVNAHKTKPNAGTLAREAMAHERAEESEHILPRDLTGEAVKDFWAFEDEVELHEAALLLEGVEPRPDRARNLRKYLPGLDDKYAQDHGGDTDAGQLIRLARIVRRARVTADRNELSLRLDYDPDGTQHEVVQLREFLRWARDRGYDVPHALQPLIHGALDVVLSQEQRRPTRTIEKATKASSEKRRNRNIQRDRRIHDLRDARKTRKEISREVGLSDSQIGRVLSRPRP